MMQADSEKLRQAWIKAVQNSIATAFRDKGDDSEVKTHTYTRKPRYSVFWLKTNVAGFLLILQHLFV